VLFGSDPTEHSAILVATDTMLRLSFLQVLDVKDLAALDLSKGVPARVGQDLFGVTRSGRGFDFAPAIQRIYVTGRLEKPRVLWDFAGDFLEVGLPVFDMAGMPVGVIVDQASASGVGSEGQETEFFILPVEAVAKSLDQARKRIPEAVEKARKASKDDEGKEKGEEKGKEDGESGEGTPPGMGEAPPEEPKPPESPR
jgi:hypothetical protein